MDLLQYSTLRTRKLKRKSHVLMLVDSFSQDEVLTYYGIELAKALDARLELFDVQFSPRESKAKDYRRKPQIDRLPEFEQAERQLQLYVSFVKLKYAETDYSIVKSLMNGKVPKESDVWLKKIKKLRPQIVLIREHQHRDVLQTFAGTEETRLVNKASCPVLVLPNSVQHPRGLDHISYVLPRSYPLRKAVKDIKFLAKIVEAHRGVIDILYITPDPDQVSDQEINILKGRIFSRLNALYYNTIRIFPYSRLTGELVVNGKKPALVSLRNGMIKHLKKTIDFNARQQVSIETSQPVLHFS